jgi:alkanesulfonate monooxygenase SsuD/methylene tetrahydromethanopterin reductase-like flavin-dependent oxidoreductase (luciferase family)
VIAHGDGWMPIEGFGWSIDDIHRLREAAEAAGGDPATVRVIVYSATPDRNRADTYADAGVDEIVYALPTTRDDIARQALAAAGAIACEHASSVSHSRRPRAQRLRRLMKLCSTAPSAKRWP